MREIRSLRELGFCDLNVSLTRLMEIAELQGENGVKAVLVRDRRFRSFMKGKIESVFYRFKYSLESQIDDRWKIERLRRIYIDSYTINSFIDTFLFTPDTAILRLVNYAYRKIFPLIEDDKFVLELVRGELALMKEELMSIYEKHIEIPVSNLMKYIERREEEEKTEEIIKSMESN